MTALAFDPWVALAKIRSAGAAPPKAPNPPNPAPPPASGLDDLGGLGGGRPAEPNIVAAPVALRAPVPAEPPPPASDWWTLPYGPERGEAFAAAREAPGACYGCAGRRWWRGEGETEGGRCWTCHPRPPGLAVCEVAT